MRPFTHNAIRWPAWAVSLVLHAAACALVTVSLSGTSSSNSHQRPQPEPVISVTFSEPPSRPAGPDVPQLPEPVPPEFDAADTPPPESRIRPEDPPLKDPRPLEPEVPRLVPVRSRRILDARRILVVRAQPPKPNLDNTEATAQTQPSTVASPPGAAKNPPPPYPTLARRLGYEGLVVLHVTISPAGECVAVSVKRSSGHEILDNAARDAIRTWQFKPAMINDTPVQGELDIPIQFKLTD